jgi:transcription-repair coupling factor (superfamily II helicase)
MDFDNILELYKNSKPVQEISTAISAKEKMPLHIKGTCGSLPAFIVAAITKKINSHHYIICEDKESAAYFLNDLQQLLLGKDILFFPHSYSKIDNFESFDKNSVLYRAEALNRLANTAFNNEIIVTYPEALVEKIIKVETIKAGSISMKVGEKLDIGFITELLMEYGFERVDFVYEPGEYSIRGGIIDIFSYGNENPYRVELFDDEVESLRIFDPETQLSLKKISALNIVPDINSTIIGEKVTNLFDFPEGEVALWFQNHQSAYHRILSQYQGIVAEFERLNEVVVGDDHPLKNKKIEEVAEIPTFIFKTMQGLPQIVFSDTISDFSYRLIEYKSVPQPIFHRNFDLLIEHFEKNQSKEISNYIFTENTKQITRFNHIFSDLGKQVQFFPVVKTLSSGFIDEVIKVACYTDHQIFNRYHKYRLRESYTQNKALTIKALRDLNPGDYVTHIDHGVGIFSGLEKLNINGQPQEAIRLLYQGNDLLYVNINSLHKITKYSGKEGQVPKINKLGSDAWQNLKKKTKAKIKDIAESLIKLYAARRAQKGFAFQPDTYLQDELEASFLYEDTPDQIKATAEIKADMEKEQPMDRLVCGDVGFGKTEVAIRAAFKAVNDSKQVAVLVPTTILAFQHFKTFSTRLADFPCKVDYISRFKSAKQKTQTLKELQEGKVDIVIGTHALLNKKTNFKDLGLLIIDEEQKFGVGAKEKLRELAHNVDTLTLSATPIPRTLKFSMMGARDLTIIQTPPPNRQPVTTEVHVLDPKIIQDAIEFEVYRGGQVFFIHNKVKDIQEVGVMIKNLVPDVEIAVAHGQMTGDKLEEILLDFMDGKFDVLVSTNIVESGLDIPNANTIIINNAHHFGLSDLHQLRGRVGRSNKKAYCYLFSPPISSLSTEARQRLRTIEEFSDLGSGFNISLRDMDIRGAGNLLGGEQSGFIADIGFDMYHKILDEAIRELKYSDFRELFKEEIANTTSFTTDCQIDADTDMFIPDSYVSNSDERLKLYTEIDNINKEEELEVFKNKLKDRFGKIPREVHQLFEALRLRWIATQLGFERIILKNNKMRCYFIKDDTSPYFESEQFTKILTGVQSFGNRCNIKQSPNGLLLSIDHIKSLSEATGFLNRL